MVFGIYSLPTNYSSKFYENKDENEFKKINKHIGNRSSNAVDRIYYIANSFPFH